MIVAITKAAKDLHVKFTEQYESEVEMHDPVNEEVDWDNVALRHNKWGHYASPRARSLEPEDPSQMEQMYETPTEEHKKIYAEAQPVMRDLLEGLSMDEALQALEESNKELGGISKKNSYPEHACKIPIEKYFDQYSRARGAIRVMGVRVYDHEAQERMHLVQSILGNTTASMNFPREWADNVNDPKLIEDLRQPLLQDPSAKSNPGELATLFTHTEHPATQTSGISKAKKPKKNRKDSHAAGGVLN